MWDLWWTKRHLGRFSPSTSVSPANSHSTDCSILIISRPGLVQLAKQWLMYQMDSVSPRPKKLKKKLLSYSSERGLFEVSMYNDFCKCDSWSWDFNVHILTHPWCELHDSQNLKHNNVLEIFHQLPYTSLIF
jgi:hypothetical protein